MPKPQITDVTGLAHGVGRHAYECSPEGYLFLMHFVEVHKTTASSNQRYLRVHQSQHSTEAFKFTQNLALNTKHP